ncbi:heme exporter protein C [Granulicella pectinivorans]|uniref:Heme exporter protein C n=1 Tax=Granulicella pectinivorans TaxID=474950 RepID=A0A1I6M4G0_9BACT|nr:heme exporter protein C [Granulicella pectinivorans]
MADPPFRTNIYTKSIVESTKDTAQHRIPPLAILGFLATIAVLAYATFVALLRTPTEATMGDIQRIFYYHVPHAIIAEIFPYVNLVASAVYLFYRTKNPARALVADAYALAAAELTVLFCSIGLITGMMWARPVWGIWWTWDARLTSFFLLWILYVSYLVLRKFSSTGQTQSLAAILSIFAAVDVPIVFMSIRWWRTQHPAPVFGGDGDLDPSFYPAFIWCSIGWCLWAAFVFVVRYKLERRRQLNEQAAAFATLDA